MSQVIFIFVWFLMHAVDNLFIYLFFFFCQRLQLLWLVHIFYAMTNVIRSQVYDQYFKIKVSDMWLNWFVVGAPVHWITSISSSIFVIITKMFKNVMKFPHRSTSPPPLVPISLFPKEGGRGRGGGGDVSIMNSAQAQRIGLRNKNYLSIIIHSKRIIRRIRITFIEYS